MKTDHTAPELLEAVGVDWLERKDLHSWPGVYKEYIGPALGTPELDALLLVAGVKCVREHAAHYRKQIWDCLAASLPCLSTPLMWSTFDVWLISDTPGHALARAIREVDHA